MPIAAEYTDLGGGLAYWSAYDPATKVDLCATALTIGGRLFFADPILLTSESLGELVARAVPAGIVLTSGNHVRDAETFRDSFSVPICASAEAAESLGLEPDILLPAGPQAIFDGALLAVPLPGGAPGETALFRPTPGGGVLVVGDALIHLGSQGFSILPEKYCADYKLLRSSLHDLLQLSFDKLFFAHGDPILADARERLRALLTF